MNARKQINLKMMLRALDSEDMFYTVRNDSQILLGLPGMVSRGQDQADSLCLNFVSAMIEANEHGLLMMMRAPVRMKAGSEEQEDRILDLILEENINRLFGGLLYDSQSGMLVYRAFFRISENTDDLPEAELLSVMESCRRAVANMYFKVHAMLHGKQVGQTGIAAFPEEGCEDEDEDGEEREQRLRQACDELMALLELIDNEPDGESGESEGEKDAAAGETPESRGSDDDDRHAGPCSEAFATLSEGQEIGNASGEVEENEEGGSSEVDGEPSAQGIRPSISMMADRVKLLLNARTTDG
ncbi:MAG: hypothetical protein IJE08_01350 [Clostridia bacterium]|nr:hypothetical protein [Clostridia bacterium]